MLSRPPAAIAAANSAWTAASGVLPQQRRDLLAPDQIAEPVAADQVAPRLARRIGEHVGHDLLMVVPAQRLADQVAGGGRGAAVGELRAWRVVGAELQEAGRVAAIDPAVADVEHEAPLRPDHDARDRGAHARQARLLAHQREQLGVDLEQQPGHRRLVHRLRGPCDQALGHRPARHLARGMPAQAVGDEADQRRRDPPRQRERRRQRRADHQLADRDAVLVALTHRTLVREGGCAEIDGRRHRPGLDQAVRQGPDLAGRSLARRWTAAGGADRLRGSTRRCRAACDDGRHRS